MSYESNIGLNKEYTEKLEKLCGKYINKISKIKELIDIAYDSYQEDYQK